MSALRVLVCGGRDYADWPHVAKVLDELHVAEGVALVIHGAARGADRLAADWAKLRGVSVLACPADWATYRNAAGPIRNAKMLAEHQPDLVVAFPGGRGTADMVEKAEAAGVRVVKL